MTEAGKLRALLRQDGMIVAPGAYDGITARLIEQAGFGAVYMTYQWWIGACNELTIDHLDPISKTPEYKYCAVKLETIDDQRWAENYVQTEYSHLKARLRDAVDDAIVKVSA